jgi:PAS domain S-box-containing protein
VVKSRTQEELEKMVEKFKKEACERKQAEEKLCKSEYERSILNQIANIFLTAPDEAMYERVLAVVLRVMRSKYGIFGFIGDQGELIIPSLTRGIWNECQVSDKSLVFPSDSWGESIWGRAIKEKKSFYADGPFRTPEGHIHIDYFFTVPIVFEQQTIGLLSVANKEGGYTEEDKVLLESIVGKISPILNARLQRDRLGQECKQAEEQFRGLAANSPVGVYIVQKGKFVYTNPQFQRDSGYREDELLGMEALSLVFPKDREIVRDNALQMLKGKRVVPYEFRITNKNGEIKWALESVASIQHQGKQATISSYQDITERKKTEQQMLSLQAQFLQAQKMEAIGQLAGGVAHDFNNLLTVISIQTQLALRGLRKDDPLEDKLKDIEQAADQAANLTRQLLAFSRRQILEIKVVNLNFILNDLEKMLRRVIGEHIEFKTVFADDLGLVKVDPGQMEQVIINLAVNARDAMPEGGKLFIETVNVELDEKYRLSYIGMLPGAYVMLSVNDTGVGMTEEVKEQIFDPFFTTKEKGKGTGLGLSTVYGIVKQSGGDIYVYSEVGKGTTIKIYLPRVFEPPEELKGEAPVEKIPQGNETVLVVEDDSSVRKLAVDILRMQGYKVLEAAEGEEALIICEKENNPIHIILTDVVMPNMDGPQLIERLKRAGQDFKVLYMSGYADETVVHHRLVEKGVNLIHKPFTVEKLTRKIREVLDKN